jgi:hypothetical protein
MSDLVFTQGFAPLKREDIRDFERRQKIVLPSKYRDFLLKTNGGHPHKPLFPGCYVETMFSITRRSRDASIEEDIAIMADALPPDLIPIGYANGGDRICLSLTDETIYLWERELGYESHPPSTDELRYLAKDIDEFLGNLEGDDDPVPDDEQAKIGRWGDISILDDYLSRGGDINEISPSGNSIIRSAVNEVDLGFVQECAARGAALKGRGLLHVAALKMNYAMMKYLLERGLDPNEPNEQGKTPMDFVEYFRRHGPAAQLLKEFGGATTQKK